MRYSAQPNATDLEPMSGPVGPRVYLVTPRFDRQYDTVRVGHDLYNFCCDQYIHTCSPEPYLDLLIISAALKRANENDHPSPPSPARHCPFFPSSLGCVEPKGRTPQLQSSSNNNNYGSKPGLNFRRSTTPDLVIPPSQQRPAIAGCGDHPISLSTEEYRQDR